MRLLSLFLFFTVSCAIAQDQGYLTIAGTVTNEGATLSGVTAVLYKSGKKIETQTTKGNGKFEFTNLYLSPKDETYIVELSKQGHITTKHLVSTKVPADLPVFFPKYSFYVDLFKSIPGIDKSLLEILQSPISKFVYSVAKKDFIDDRAYFSTIKARIEQLFEILEAEEADRYRLLQEYKSAKEKELARDREEEEAKKKAEEQTTSDKGKEYDETIKKGDQSFQTAKAFGNRAKDLKKAREYYTEASSMKPEEGYPKNKLKEISALLGEVTEEIVAIKEEDKNRKPSIAASQPPVSKPQTITTAQTDAVAETKPEEEKTTDKPAEQSPVKTDKELKEENVVNALAERERMQKESMDEIIIERKEKQENAIIEQMNTAIMARAKAEIAVKETQQQEIKKTVSQTVKSENTQLLMTMLAETESGKNDAAVTREEKQIAKTPEDIAKKDSLIYSRYQIQKKTIVQTSQSVQQKPLAGRNRGESVKIIHYTLKKDLDEKIKEEIKPVAKEIEIKPFITMALKEEAFKTVKMVVVKYPVKEDTYKKITYLWGTEYFYKNNEEIDQKLYNKELAELTNQKELM